MSLANDMGFYESGLIWPDQRKFGFDLAGWLLAAVVVHLPQMTPNSVAAQSPSKRRETKLKVSNERAIRLSCLKAV